MTGISFTPKFPISPYVAPALVNFLPTKPSDEKYFEVLTQVAADVWGVPVESIHSKYQGREAVRARQFIMTMLLKKTDWCQSEIARRFNRDHSTVFHARVAVKNAFEGYDNAFLGDYQLAERAVMAQFQ